MSKLPIAPFDPARYIGTVCQVGPVTVRVNLPYAASPISDHHAGYQMLAGQVGEFILIEGEEHAIIGRIIEVKLPDQDRLLVEPTADINGQANPIGLIQLLTSLNLSTGLVVNGIPAHPRIAQQIFSAHPLLIKHAVEQGFERTQNIKLGFLPNSLNMVVSLSPEALVGRHCAVLGATGGGKSWTVARLIEEIARLGGKAIVFDATGEFGGLGEGVRHVYLGGNPVDQHDSREFVGYPYQYLSEADLFVLFNPTAASQAPKLREALKSLKLVALNDAVATDGYLIKTNRDKPPIESELKKYAHAIESEGADFDINNLPGQIEYECVKSFGAKWGGCDEQVLGYCSTLIAKINVTLKSPYMDCIFSAKNTQPLPEVISSFLHSKDSILRISMEDLPFEHNTREIVTNAIGRYLLKEARSGKFEENPAVVILDEAHQFLDKSLGDEYNKISLESFGLIAKEGRKYGLTTVLATQRPRDIPEDVLSQMGMFIVHRLINEKDRQIVERACGNMDASAAAFLPILGQGEAILVGIGSPMPLPIQIIPPYAAPKSDGPQYKTYWGR